VVRCWAGGAGGLRTAVVPVLVSSRVAAGENQAFSARYEASTAETCAFSDKSGRKSMIFGSSDYYVVERLGFAGVLYD